MLAVNPNHHSCEKDRAKNEIVKPVIKMKSGKGP